MEHKTSYIITYTGKRMYPLEPEMASIDIADIAHALSMMTRANGHFREFHSVGQHCIECCEEARLRGYSDRVSLACLLHDASESYMADVTRPVKKSLPIYREAEERLIRLILEKYISGGVTEEEWQMVKEIDNTLLYYEFLHFMNHKLEPVPPKIWRIPDFEPVSMKETEQRFLELFGELKSAESR